MNRVVVGLIALGLGAASVGRLAYAQDAGSPVITNADGSYVVSSDRGTTSTIDANGRDVVYGDITTGPGGVILGLPTPTPAPSDGGNGGGRNSDAPNLHPTADDTDGDNLSNELEAQFGTDPSNPDSDNDGVADGDEVNIYHTDPTKFDTDGDGHGDGEELFWLHTDPLDRQFAAAQPIDRRPDGRPDRADKRQATRLQAIRAQAAARRSGFGGQQGDVQSSEHAGRDVRRFRLLVRRPERLRSGRAHARPTQRWCNRSIPTATASLAKDDGIAQYRPDSERRRGCNVPRAPLARPFEVRSQSAYDGKLTPHGRSRCPCCCYRSHGRCRTEILHATRAGREAKGRCSRRRSVH